MSNFILGVLVGVVLVFFLLVKWLWVMAKALVAAKAMIDKTETENIKLKCELKNARTPIAFTGAPPFMVEKIRAAQESKEHDKNFMKYVHKILNGKHE